MDESQKFNQLITQSEHVLIISHISPDPDAVCSVLLLGRTLQKNFPEKQILMALEETVSQNLNFLTGYGEIEFGPIIEKVKLFKPDLLISVDAAGMQRLSRNDNQVMSDLIYDQLKSKVIVIDHHPKDASVKADLYIKSSYPATAQEIYELVFERLSLQEPEGYAETALLGIVRDSNRFLYNNVHHRKTFSVVSDLLDAGASIEHLEYKLERYSKNQLTVLANLMTNIVTSREGYSYSFIDDEFSQSWTAEKGPIDAFKAACDIFGGQFLRNIEQNFWGFVVYPELQSADKSYSVSFRAVSGGVDVARIAASLGGGGHKEAAGAKNT